MLDLIAVNQVEKLLLGTGRHENTRGEKYEKVLRMDPCAYCGRKFDPRQGKKRRKAGINRNDSMTVDHIFPRPAGRGWENQTGSCYRCNQSKAESPLLFHLLHERHVHVSRREYLRHIIR